MTDPSDAMGAALGRRPPLLAPLLLATGLALLLAASLATPAVAANRAFWGLKTGRVDHATLKRIRGQGFNAVVAGGLTKAERNRVRAARLTLLPPRSRRGLRVVSLAGPRGVVRLRRGKTRVLAVVRLTIAFDSAAWSAAVARAADAPWLDLAVAPRGINSRGALGSYLVVLRRIRKLDRLSPTLPSALGVSERKAASLRLSWRASRDNRGVAGYGLYRDGAKVGTSSGASAVFVGLTCGRSYRLGVDAVDRTGNRSGRAQVTGSTASCSPGDSPPPPPGPPPPPAPPGLGGALPPALPPSGGTTYYVSTSGSDSWPGTLAQPWRTVQKALNTLTAGQRALVRAGTYAQNHRFDRAGSMLAPITIEAYPGELPVLRPAAPSGSYALEITGSYLRVRGFVLENAKGTSGTNVYLENPSHHVELSRNEVRFSQDQGIYVEGNTHHHQLLGNRIHDNGLGHVPGQHQSHGIYLEGASHLVASNVIHDHPYGFGIQVYPENTGSMIVGNSVVASGYAGIVLGGSGGVSGIVVRNNVFAFNSQHGIAHDSACATASVADRNVLHGNGSGAIESGCNGVDRSGGNRTTDPLFTNLPGRDLHPLGGSAAIDYALLQYSPLTDFDGRLRTYGAGPDAGSFERPS